MSRLARVAAGTVAIMLVSASTAVASSNTLKGPVKGEPGASVQLTVQLNAKGEPVRVSGVKVAGAGYVCTDRTTGKIGSKNLPGSAKVKKQTDLKGKPIWIFNMSFNPGTGTGFSGQLNSKGTRATGSVTYSFPKEAGTENFCEVSAGFTANK